MGRYSGFFRQQQVIRVYSLPDGTFSSDEEEEEEEDEEDEEEEGEIQLLRYFNIMYSYSLSFGSRLMVCGSVKLTL